MRSRNLCEPCNLSHSGGTVVAERITDCDEIYIADPVLEIPGQGSSEHQDYIDKVLLIASSSLLVPMKPKVSIDEFSKVLTLVKANGEFLHGAQFHFSTSALRQYDATAR